MCKPLTEACLQDNDSPETMWLSPSKILNGYTKVQKYRQDPPLLKVLTS